MKLPVTIETRMDLIHINAEGKVTSRNVAEVFGKRHDNVLRTIEIIAAEGGALKFEVSNYLTSQGKTEKEYLLNKAEFSLLVMEFSGKPARAFKRAYVERFEAMETKLRAPTSSLDLMQLTIDNMRNQEKGLLKLVETNLDSSLTNDQVVAIEDAIANKREELGLDIKYRGRIIKSIKNNAFKIGQRGNRTYKEIPQRLFTDSIDIINKWEKWM